MFTTINGIQINYKCQGKGDFIFLLHGWGSNIENFNSMADVMAEKYTVVAPDLPGFGLSSEPPRVFDVDDYTDVVVEFIKSFGAKKVILLGHSFGGRVIIKMANRKNLPFEISKIILVDSAGIRPKRSFLWKLRVRVYKAAKIFLNSYPVKKLFPYALNKLRKKLGSADYAQASEIMRGCLVKVVNEDLTPLLSSIKSETLLIWGDKDTATPLEDGQKMEKLIPGSGLVVLKGAGHYSFLEQPYLFNRVIKSFLKIGE